MKKQTVGVLRTRFLEVRFPGVCVRIPGVFKAASQGFQPREFCSSMFGVGLGKCVFHKHL